MRAAPAADPLRAKITDLRGAADERADHGAGRAAAGDPGPLDGGRGGLEPVQPTWELSKAQEAPETGTCEAVPDGARWQLTAEIQPESRGDYRLTYQFGLGTEIIRRSIPIGWCEMIPSITAAAVTPQTVYAGGQILIAVTVEERYLSVSDVQAMSLTQMEQQKISKMTEGGT